MIIYTFGGILTFIALNIALKYSNMYIVVLLAAFVGFFFIPMIPTLLEFACETVFPIGEGTAVGFLAACSTFFTLVVGTILGFIVDGSG